MPQSRIASVAAYPNSSPSVIPLYRSSSFARMNGVTPTPTIDTLLAYGFNFGIFSLKLITVCLLFSYLATIPDDRQFLPFQELWFYHIHTKPAAVRISDTNMLLFLVTGNEKETQALSRFNALRGQAPSHFKVRRCLTPFFTYAVIICCSLPVHTGTQCCHKPALRSYRVSSQESEDGSPGTAVRRTCSLR